ncbi:MAG: maltose alpha-D-glucosyltransferase / alpha-amylase [Thermoanaerobaculia bacterium]|jgi:maltose alpha-D-glucosyltransferase/alpha-amylase|nr:maltose alpha-D-glucosyltransferase / alpha-amylase [Thermoanaerobaculia bacterium]
MTDLWYKDGIIYQTHVRAFFDSNNDGIGDFQGLTRKLDYLQDLGISIIWLLPFYPSPLRDDGYDIANYTAVHPSYGTLADFKVFLKEAHRRGLKVITELVINHTSDQHEWFQKSRRAKPGSPWRDFYVWSDTPSKYKDARIIFKDYETSNWTWDPVANAYYWHRFFSHQPDLNFDNPAVHAALLKAFDFWMELGVDAFRLDAIPYLYEREGTTCENLPETHVYLKSLRAHVDAKYPGKMLLAEANQWPEDSLPYFGDGDECHMAFNFPVMPRMYMALAQEDRFPIVDIMAQTPSIPENCQWAMFLRNHDELTLEMVTEEDRDYMWRTYASDRQARINLGIRRRLAPLLQNHRLRIHLLNGLLFSLPGTPIIYYGDEIGMGDNIYLGDRNGVRTPMQWSPDRNAGFSKANPQQLYMPAIIDPQYHYEQVNVEQQQSSPYSLLWWMKRLIAQRNRYQAFGRGTMEFLHPENRKILAFVRRHGDEIILVVANLSRLVQCFDIDLSEFRGMAPVELSGGTRFPDISGRPYFLNLGPFAFYWFALERQNAAPPITGQEVPVIDATTLEEVFADANSRSLRRALEAYVRSRRWFGGKARTIASLQLQETVPLPDDRGVLAFVHIEYADGEPETYIVPLGVAQARRAREQEGPNVPSMIARLRDGHFLYEPLADPKFGGELLEVIARRRTLKGNHGAASGDPSRAFRNLRGPGDLHPQVMKTEQSNTALLFGDRLFMKLFRRLEPGINTDLEVTRFLNEQTTFTGTPQLAGSIQYELERGGEPATIAVLQNYVESSGDAWRYTLDSIGRFFENILSDSDAALRLAKATPSEPLLDLAAKPFPDNVREMIGVYLSDAEVLGRRTAQMHLALASRDDIPAFAPEAITPHYQRSIYQHVRSQAVQTLQLLRRRAKGNADAEELLSREEQLQKRIRRILDGRMTGLRIRVHGDYHLGQVLKTGNDFIVIDFEGEPSRPLSERRIKRSALRDVAGMLRSFHYASSALLHEQPQHSVIRAEDAAAVESGAAFWYRWVSAAFLRAYVAESGDAAHLPRTRDELQVLLDVHLLEKALYEITYELNNRPDWVHIPLRGVLELLGR